MVTMASMADSTCYTLINAPNDNETFNELSLRNDLEKGEPKAKIEALERLIFMILNGEKFPPTMLMHIIRYILPAQCRQLKKRLLIFWEIVPKRGPDGKLLHEMILVCDAYRKDLQHPNEFIRGSTLRFLCKLKEPELLEPLMPSIRTCLEHRHSYVRRNAVLAIFKIFINFETLIPDAPELILDFLGRETDASCKRNAFLMLIHLDQSKALDYLNSCLDQITNFNDILQLVIVELIYKVCIANPTERSRFIRAIYNLLNTSTSASVRYEAAATLITLSQAPTALKAAANCFIDIAFKESDNNVKLIVLDRLVSLKDTTHAAEKVLQELLMDILRILSVASDLEVKEKILNLSLDLVTSKNSEEMAQLLKKEVIKTQNETGPSNEENCKYRQILVSTIHSICVKYPDILMSNQLLSTLCELLSTDDEKTAQLVINFCREFIVQSPPHKDIILDRILESFPFIKSVKVHRGLLWVLGEFCDPKNVPQIYETMKVVRKCIGDLPIVETELRKKEDTEKAEDSPVTNSTQPTTRAVTADGSYVTQSALSVKHDTSNIKSNVPVLRHYMLTGDYYAISSLGNCLVKLAIKLRDSKDPKFNRFVAESMFILTSIMHLGKTKVSISDCDTKMSEDDYDRVSQCLWSLSQLGHNRPELELMLNHIFMEETRSYLDVMIDSTKQDKDEIKMQPKRIIEVDDHINFSQLLSKNQELFENQFEISLSQAIGGNMGATATSSTFGKVATISDLLSSSSLSKVTQLTGISDPIYAECYVNANQFDICLDVLLVNQTNDVLQNVTLELSTMGDLKLVEKPQPIVLAPHDFANIKASVKVSSTDHGVMFGNIVYDVGSMNNDKNVVVLNDIHIDVMDYIVPASCTDQQFITMWMAFEWENKVTVNTPISDLQEYLNHLIKSTNMKCLTPIKALSGDCGFLSANLYAKSIFGEDALANISIEKPDNNCITGHIRIRAKSQGMALSLGDKFNLTQKQSIQAAA